MREHVSKETRVHDVYVAGRGWMAKGFSTAHAVIIRRIELIKLVLIG